MRGGGRGVKFELFEGGGNLEIVGREMVTTTYIFVILVAIFFATSTKPA